MTPTCLASASACAGLVDEGVTGCFDRPGLPPEQQTSQFPSEDEKGVLYYQRRVLCASRLCHRVQKQTLVGLTQTDLTQTVARLLSVSTFVQPGRP